MPPLPNLVVSSDALGSHGFRALWRTERVCSSWFSTSTRLSISFLELVPAVVAAHLWGHAWCPLRVYATIWRLSVSSTMVLPSRTTLCIFFAYSLAKPAAIILFSRPLISPADNLATNALSRLRLQEFRHLAIYVDNSTMITVAPGSACLINQCFGLMPLSSRFCSIHSLCLRCWPVLLLYFQFYPICSTCRTFRHRNGC